MGGAVIEPGGCDGGDVIKDLNHAFGHPGSDKYKYAQSNNTFGGVNNAPGNYTELIDAYTTAGVPVSDFWAAYLRLLGTVKQEGPQQGPQNIYDIAQMRYDGLINNKAMSTKIHLPKHGGHVQTKHGSGAEPSTIDSPFPLPGVD